MKHLLLMRHAKAARKGRSDFERPLAARGWKEAEAMTRIIAERGRRPDLVLCSPARRTRETLDGLAAALVGVATRFEPRLYGAEASTLLEILRDQDDEVGTVLMIGHNPGMAILVGLLAGPGAGGVVAAEEGFPTGSIAFFSVEAALWSELRANRGTLEELVTPPD